MLLQGLQGPLERLQVRRWPPWGPLVLVAPPIGRTTLCELVGGMQIRLCRGQRLALAAARGFQPPALLQT